MNKGKINIDQFLKIAEILEIDPASLLPERTESDPKISFAYLSSITKQLWDKAYYLNKEKALISLIAATEIHQKLKYGFKGDPKYYTVNEFRNKIIAIPIKKGDRLFLFIINEETGQKKEFGFKHIL